MNYATIQSFQLHNCTPSRIYRLIRIINDYILIDKKRAALRWNFELDSVASFRDETIIEGVRGQREKRKGAQGRRWGGTLFVSPSIFMVVE